MISEVLRTFFVMKTYKISHIPAGFMPKVWTILIWLTLFGKIKFVLSVIHAMNSLSSNWIYFVYPITWSIRASRRSTSRGLPTRKGREVKSSKDGEDEGFCMSSERELWRCKRELVKKRRLLFSWESRGNNEQMLRLKETGVRLWSRPLMLGCLYLTWTWCQGLFKTFFFFPVGISYRSWLSPRAQRDLLVEKMRIGWSRWFGLHIGIKSTTLFESQFLQPDKRKNKFI